jgi:pseudouridine-5'-phosphate glycosidase/sugar/nucleoside kinase (ribokinase family)
MITTMIASGRWIRQSSSRRRALPDCHCQWTHIVAQHHSKNHHHHHHHYTSTKSTSAVVQIWPAVQRALSSQRPVVALESTIVAHGMPFPENLSLSTRVAAIMRARGVEPATIAIKDGVCRVGLSVEELEELARTGVEAKKCSTREISLLLAAHRRKNIVLGSEVSKTQWGATTVASTMTLAHAAGIPVFVTGGIGGVHRDGQFTMDVSADLVELSRTPVIVVSAGIKSILDIQRTLEVLETNGVATVAYRTDEFPAFFSPHSGVAAPARVDSAEEIAEAYLAARELGLSHGMLVAVPNDNPAGAHVEEEIQMALAEASERGIVGPAVTPFILSRVAQKTKGESLRSNMALVERNAAIGAEIAHAIAARQRPVQLEKANNRSVVVVMGGAVVDIVAKPKGGHELILGTSNLTSCSESDGGVARNIAEALGRLGSNAILYSAVGDDSRGHALLTRLAAECDVESSENSVAVVKGANTATYLAVLDNLGDLHVACADMDVLGEIQPLPQTSLEHAAMLVIDSNPPVAVLLETAQLAVRRGVEVLWEPTSVPKAFELAKQDLFMSCLSYATPNRGELLAMSGRDVGFNPTTLNDPMSPAELEMLKELSTTILERMKRTRAHLIVTLGANGVLLASREQNKYSCRHFLAKKDVAVRNATGAGDSLTGAFVHGITRGKTVSEAVLIGMEAALMSLECDNRAISPKISELRPLF